MAQKCIVDGTVYEIKKGRCLVDGTAYDVKKGRTLVDGTAYDASFGPGAIAVTITKIDSSTGKYCSATIGGVTYSDSTEGVEVMPGDVMALKVNPAYKAIPVSFPDGQTSYVEYKGSIKINGVDVEKGSSSKVSLNHSWTVPDGITSIQIDLNSAAVGNITVTTS